MAEKKKNGRHGSWSTKKKTPGPRASTRRTDKKDPPDTSTWRRTIKNAADIKFDDEAKETYLREMAEHDLKTHAAAAAGVTPNTVNAHLEMDPEFAAAAKDARQAYRDKVVGHHSRLLLDGVEVNSYDKDGNLIREKREYPVRLIELELKRVEPEFRDKQQIDLNHGGGVMVAPADMSPEEWVKAQQAKNAEKEKPGE